MRNFIRTLSQISLTEKILENETSPPPPLQKPEQLNKFLLERPVIYSEIIHSMHFA